LQGCTGPVRIAWPPGWSVSQQGELLIASRYPIRESKLAVLASNGQVFSGPNVYYCTISLPQRDIAVCSVHLPSPHFGLAESLDRRTLLSDRGSRLLEEESQDRRRQSEAAVEMARGIHDPLIVAGDFNMPTDSAVYRETWGRFNNAFSRGGFGFGHTERPGSFGWLFGLRIDHILSGPNWRPFRCKVGSDVGSDHRPLIADLAWRPDRN
jgi:endonuclease/exonuclease/phosphatase family metal-dependent hydrolase